MRIWGKSPRLQPLLHHWPLCGLSSSPFCDTDINNKNSVIPENSTACVPSYKLFLCQASGIGIKCSTAQMVMIISSKPLPISFLFYTLLWASHFNNFIFLLIQLVPWDKNWFLHVNPFYDIFLIQSGSNADIRLTKENEEMFKCKRYTRFHSHPAAS